LREEWLLHLSWILNCLSVGEVAEVRASWIRQLFAAPQSTPETEATAFARLKGCAFNYDADAQTATFERLRAAPMDL